MAGRGNGRGSGRGSGKRVRRPVSEADRISLVERLREFRDSNAQTLTFEAGMSNHDRAVVHESCKKMGFKSKSYGAGDQRRVTVTKSAGQQLKGPAAPMPIFFSRETHEAMQQLFMSFPPSDEEGAQVGGNSSKASKAPVAAPAREKLTCLKMTPEDMSQQLAALAKRRRTVACVRQIAQATAKLPVASYRDTITSCVDANQVVIIAGETGCGKSTQVPQFLLDHMWERQKPCRIVCTQPRRISATSVADRVASERGEPVGDTVGYQIRLESRGGPHSSLMFCTNGVLLRKLVTPRQSSNDAVNGIGATHVLVDEIHERDCNADFLLIVLKDLLASQPNLRLVLMSATLDAELFSNYFNGCPVLKIPGFTYPVHVHHLEDVLVLTNFGNSKGSKNGLEENGEYAPSEPIGPDAELENAMTYAWLDDDFEPLMGLLADNPTPEIFNYKHFATGATPLMVAAGKGRFDELSLLLSLGADCSLVSRDGETALDWAEKYGQDETAKLLVEHVAAQANQAASEEAELLGEYHKTAVQDGVDVILIERLLHKISEAEDEGAILVFLPGWEDITRCKDRLAASATFGDGAKYLVLPLHSMVPMKDQKRVFQSPPAGVRKIVLATNIAETAITIDDIVYVVDTGRMKEKSYDPFTNVSTFQTTWISKASARQRQGRAGRCRPGVCYRLFSKTRAAALLDFQVPEMKRTPLEELCLKVKLLEPHGSIREFLSKALDPPIDVSIQNAVRLLQDLGALDSEEELTELGRQLGSLPVHPATSKMLLLAILLNCLEPALTIACATGYRDPFILPIGADQKRQAVAVKQQFSAVYGGYSDHLAVVAAFEGWVAAKKSARFCSQKFLSPGVMFMLEGMRQQLLNELVHKGFVPKDIKACSLNAQDPGIVRAILVASMYPMVGKFLPPLPNGQKAVVQTPRGEKVRIHPHSTNFKLVHASGNKAKVYSQHLLVFDEITRGEAQVYIRNSTVVKPHPLLFICGELAVAPLEYDSNHKDDDVLLDAPESSIAMVVDRWLQYQTTSVEAAQIYCLRERLQAALQFKIKNPRAPLPDMLGASLYALACILSYEGPLAIQPPDAPSFNGSNMVVSQQQRDTRPWPRQGQPRNFQPEPRPSYVSQEKAFAASRKVRVNATTMKTGVQVRSAGQQSSSQRGFNATAASTSTRVSYVAKTRNSD